MKHFFVRHHHNTGATFGAGLAGAAIGAAIAYYFLGTEDGARKRTKLARMAKKVKTKATELKEDIKDTINDTMDEMEEIEDEDEEELER